MNKPHVHAEVIKAWADGAEIETYNKPIGEWVKCCEPCWFTDEKYRVKPKVAHKIGNKYSFNGSEYMLVQHDAFQVVLISIKGFDVGNRWTSSVPVENAFKISEQEFNRICLDDNFELMTE